MFKTLELPGGFAPLDPLPGLCPGPTGGLKQPPDPSPNDFAPPPPFLIPGYGPERTTLGQDRKDEVLSFSMFGIYNKNL